MPPVDPPATDAAAPRRRPDVAGDAAIALLAILVLELALRVPFPCDMLSWPESVFLTAMMKLRLAQPLFGQPSDVNSWVRGPGLEYLGFWLLGPLGLALDVRAGRLVAILLATVGAATLTRAAVPPGASRRLRWSTFAVAMLAAFSTTTADAPYEPALLLALVGSVTLATVVAIRSGNLGAAAAAVMLASLGVLVMQEAAFAVAGVWTALAVARRFRWPWLAALLVVGAAATAASYQVIHGLPWADFYLFELPSNTDQPSHWLDTAHLFYARGLVVVAVCTPACVAALRGSEAGRAFALAWLTVGASTVLPALFPWVPITTDEGTRRVLATWLVVPVWVACGLPDGGAPGIGWAPGLRVCIRAATLFLFFPLLPPPSADAAHYCAAVTDALRADRAADRRILVGNALTPWLKIHPTTVPTFLDLPAMALERGGYPRYMGRMRVALALPAYDRVYQALGTAVERAMLLDNLYRVMREIPAATPPIVGFDPLVPPTTGVYDQPKTPLVRYPTRILEPRHR